MHCSSSRSRSAPGGTGIPVAYTNAFWGGRSEIKPSEVIPAAYEAWCREVGLDAGAMR